MTVAGPAFSSDQQSLPEPANVPCKRKAESPVFHSQPSFSSVTFSSMVHEQSALAGATSSIFHDQSSFAGATSSTFHGQSSFAGATSSLTLHGQPSFAGATSSATLHGQPSLAGATSSTLHGQPSFAGATSSSTLYGQPSFVGATSSSTLHGQSSFAGATSSTLHGQPSFADPTSSSMFHGQPSFADPTSSSMFHGATSSAHRQAVTTSAPMICERTERPTDDEVSHSRMLPYMCSECSFVTAVATQIENHVKIHTKGGIFCGVCRATYRSVRGFKLHALGCRSLSCDAPILASESYENDNLNATMYEENLLHTKMIPAMALQLTTRNRIPKNALSALFNQLTLVLEEVENSEDPQASLEEVKRSCGRLSTPYRLTQELRQKFQATEPIPVALSTGSTAYYYPLMETLQQLLRIEEVVEYVLQPSHGDVTPNFMSDVCHGSHASSTAAPQRMPFLRIAIYIDDIEMCNPLGKAKGEYKLTVIYFHLLNIPSRYRSTSESVFPLAVANSKALRKSGTEGMELLLKDAINLMTELDGEGKTFIIRGQSITIYGRIKACFGDALALNGIGGFKECFNPVVLRCCRSCDITNVEMRQKHDINLLPLRNLQEHNVRLDELESLTTEGERTEWSKLYGISCRSALSSFTNFDITQCLPHDPMHVILEGVFPHELRLMTNVHIANGMYTVSQLNEFFKTFSYGAIDKHDIPHPLPDDCNVRTTQTSGSVLVMMRHIPFFMSSKVGGDDAHWKCLLLLIQIQQIVMSPLVNEQSVNHISQLIQQHNDKFLDLYPADFIPKLHFMEHFPHQLTLFGPLRNQMCLTFEQKHRVCKSMKWFNFKNLPLSVITHLYWTFIASITDMTGCVKLQVFSKPDEAKLSPHSDQLFRMVLGGVQYGLGDVLMTDNISFVEIKELQITASGLKRFVVEELRISSFNHTGNYFVLQKGGREMSTLPEDYHYPWPAIVLRPAADVIHAIPRALPYFPHLN
jgi:hypothetical protein